MSKLEIYVATHKGIFGPEDPDYITMQAGAALFPSLGIAGDNSGDNISVRNPYYSELTVQYWMWKNADCDFLGLVHYRRYFGSREEGIMHMGKRIASGEELHAQIKRANFILTEPQSFHFPYTSVSQSVEQQYIACHGFEIFHAREAVRKINPDYLSAYDFVMRNNKLYAFNLFITRKEIFDLYCKWVFRILFEIEGIIPLFSINGYQMRILAFLSERLFTVWILQNRSLLHLDHRSLVFYDGI